jgi:hypothetical protein
LLVTGVEGLTSSLKNIAQAFKGGSKVLAGADGTAVLTSSVNCGEAIDGALKGGSTSGWAARNIMYSKLSKKSGKERASDIPSWVKGQKPIEGENGKDFAKRICDEKYGEGNYQTGPGSEYNKIKKFGDRGC